MSDAQMHGLGRRRGLWVPAEEVQRHLAFGWELIEVAMAGPDAVLLAPPQWQQEKTA